MVSDMREEIFRQKVQVGKTIYGQVGFERWNNCDQLAITSYEGPDREVYQVVFPLEAVPHLLKLLLHAWSTKTREFENETFAFPRRNDE